MLRLRLGLGLGLALGLAGCGREAAPDELVVFAAASTRPAVEDAAGDWRPRGVAVRASYAASSTLAKQLAAGAPGDVFVSASEAWVRDLEGAGVVDHVRAVASNRLVLVSGRDGAVAWAPGGEVALAEACPGKLALGDPAHVPAGVYAKAALQALGAWEALAPRVAGAADVRGALAFVARGDAPCGIVYLTDARDSAEVRVVAELPARLHPPIVYFAARVKASARAAEAAAFVDGLAAGEHFVRHGFGRAP